MLVKSLTNCNRNCQGRPAGLNRLTVAAVYMYRYPVPHLYKFQTKSYSLIPFLFGSLSFIFVVLYGSLLHVFNYFEIDHDDGTVRNGHIEPLKRYERTII